MQEIIEKQNTFFLPQMISIPQQMQILKCINHNQASLVCISSECLQPGLICLQNQCQCRDIHSKCHNVFINRILKSIQKHQKQVPEKVKQTYQVIYNMINDMIEQLSNLRTKFEKQQYYFGLRQQQIQFLNLIYDKKINEINGKIICCLEKSFDARIEFNKNTKEDIIKDFQIKRKQFNKLCNYIYESYSQVSQIKIRQTNAHFLQDSTIIKESQDKQTLIKWLKQQFDNHQVQSKLIFRASQHNFEAIKFHQFCDGKNDTLVVIKNQYDKVIGGFTSTAWTSSGQTSLYDYKNRSFIFSINLKEKYKNMNPNKDRSIYSSSNHGPEFGSGSDFLLSNRCNQNRNSWGSIGYSYNREGNNKLQPTSQQTKTLFTGNPNSNKFSVKQYEVYQITYQ